MKLSTKRTDRQTLRLATSYLGVMIFVSVIFSIVFYTTSANALHFNTFQHQTPTAAHTQGTAARLPALPSPTQILQSQTALIKRRLLVRLIVLNAGVLAVGGTMSYYLARRTLRPIQQAMDTQQQFFSNASHELKTPLSALHLRGEVALRNPKLTLAEAKETIASNVEQAVKLERLSRDLLRLAKAGHAADDLRQTSLPAVIAEAMQQVEETAHAKSIHIVSDIPSINVFSNAQQLAQVVAIVLDNAIKYGPPNTAVHLSAHQDKKETTLSINDEGPGIGAADLPHIFERFYQGDQSRKREGFGLGLSIAAGIMHQLHGDIRVDPSSSGTTFTVRIPALRRKN